MPATRARLGVIFLTVFIDLIGFGLILPILPYFAQRFGAGGLGFGALIGVYSLMQFVATIVLGRLSDRVGRRPVLLATIIVSFTGYLMFAFAGSYAVLFLARTISGFSGGNISVAQAYIADVTTPAERSRGMGLVGAAFGLGFIVGPALGGLAGHYGGPMAVGLLGAGLCAANFGSAFAILGESLGAEHRRARPLFDVGHLVAGLRDPRLGPVFVVFAIIPFAFAGYMVALPLYAGDVFGWGERELGLFFTEVGVTAALVQGWLFGRLARHVSDRTLAIVGVLGMALPIAIVPYVGNAAGLYVWVIVLAFSNSLASPALHGLISTLADASEQGAMLGAAQAFSALGRLSGPVVFGQVYDAVAPAAAFLAAGAVMAAAGVVSLRIGRAVARETMPRD